MEFNEAKNDIQDYLERDPRHSLRGINPESLRMAIKAIDNIEKIRRYCNDQPEFDQWDPATGAEIGVKQDILEIINKVV